MEIRACLRCFNRTPPVSNESPATTRPAGISSSGSETIWIPTSRPREKCITCSGSKWLKFSAGWVNIVRVGGMEATMGSSGYPPSPLKCGRSGCARNGIRNGDIRRNDFAEWYRASSLRFTTRLHQFWPAQTDKAKDRGELTPSFAKIREAIDAELAAGGRLDGLRPRERNKRLSDRLIQRGYNSKELPHGGPPRVLQ